MVKGLRQRILRVILLAAIVNLLNIPVLAAGPKLVLVLWHGLTWDDLKASQLYADGLMALGTMNTRIGGGEMISGAYLTISSGSRAFGTHGAAAMYHSHEQTGGVKAGQLYELRTGRTGNNRIVNPQIASIRSAFAEAKYPLEVGALADALRRANLKIGVFGNSDLQDQRVRWAALVGMDSDGQAALGLVSDEVLIEDSAYPHGKRTDYHKLLAAVLGSDADLAVVDLGDPYRLSTYVQHLIPEQLDKLKARMVREAWDFIAELYAELPQAEILIAAPYPSADRAEVGRWFAPVIVIGGDAGLLTSGTTKWPGIISNIDLAPTIANRLNADKGTMLGRAVTVDRMESQAALALIEQLEERVFWVNQHRGSVLRILVGIQVVLYLVTLALLIIPKVLSRRFVRSVQLCLVLSLSLPLILLLLPQGWYWPMLIILLLVLVNLRCQNQLASIMAVALITAGLIIVDVIRGGVWIRYSFLGYDPVGGARYYGIGNEYMGILIGSAIMGWALLRERPWVKTKNTAFLDLAVFLAVVFIIAAPQWGTNVGGMIAAICGFGIAWLLAHSRLPWYSCVVVVGLAVAAALIGLMQLDVGRPEDLQSHIGQTTGLISANGLNTVKDIIVRKLSMNLRLLRYSIWSRALLIAIAAMGASLIWPSRYLQWLLKNYPDLVVGIVGTLTGTTAALIFNDSGVVAAATCSFFAATTMLTLALSLKHNLLPAQSHVEKDPHS